MYYILLNSKVGNNFEGQKNEHTNILGYDIFLLICSVPEFCFAEGDNGP